MRGEKFYGWSVGKIKILFLNKKNIFFQHYTLEMMNKISNVNTTNPPNKVHINEAHLLIVAIKHNTKKKQVIFIIQLI